MLLSQTAAFWATSFILVLVPGADWAYVIGATLRRRGTAATCGILLGYAVLTAVVATGVGMLVAATPAALTSLALAGGAYLVWTGVATWRRPPAAAADGSMPSRSWIGPLGRGIAVSALNPKAFLLFLALLPQFVGPEGRWSVPAQVAGLGGVHMLNCAVVYLGVGLLAGSLLAARPTAARVVARTAGGCMVLIGVLVVAERLAGA